MAARTTEDICNLALLYAGVNQRIGKITDPTAPAQACNTIYDEFRVNLYGAFRWPFAIKRKQLTPYSGNAYDATATYGVGAMVQYGTNVYRSLLAANLNHTPSDNASAAWWFQVTRDGWAFVCPLPNDFIEAIACWEKPTVSQFGTPQVFYFKDPSDSNLRNPRSNERAPFALENANDGTDLVVLLTDIDTPILQYTADVSNPAVLPTEFVEALARKMAGPLAMSLRGDEKKAEALERSATRRESEAFVSSMRGQQEDAEPVSEFEAARK